LKASVQPLTAALHSWLEAKQRHADAMTLHLQRVEERRKKAS